MHLYSKADVLADLRELNNRMSSQKALAKKIGIHPVRLSEMLHERKPISKKVLIFLGYEKVEAYKAVK